MPNSKIDFQTEPKKYRHWRLSFDGPVATLAMDVDEKGGLRPNDYELKLNSYDLGVDIELYDATQRLRFEHPEVGAVLLTSAKEKVFCAGANIKMLGSSTHGHKVNFCKFTNETRNGIEDATEFSGQTYIAAVNGACAGGGYELALAADQIVLVDDGSSAVALPELPLLAVLPGTGGLTRLVDKRHIRRDRADFFCTIEEGIKGKRAVEWDLVDEIVPSSRFKEGALERAKAAAAKSDRPKGAKGIVLTPLDRKVEDDALRYGYVSIKIDRERRAAEITVSGPKSQPPKDAKGVFAEGAKFWPLALARELDDAILHLRLNEPEIGTWIWRTEGEADSIEAYDRLLAAEAKDWLVREVTLYLKRVLKRIDVTSRSLIALAEPGSVFTGTLLELLLASDLSFQLLGKLQGDNRPPATLRLTAMNFGAYPMVNGLTRLQSRFLKDPSHVDVLKKDIGKDLDAEAADERGLVTFIPDDIDFEDEVRLAIEQRASFSPDSLTGMEANLRFGGPETMESKIFSRLSAWQNWIFQRPNAVDKQTGALAVYGTGRRAEFNKERV